MVNFRFHLVSLTAVFLALAAGITIGAGVVDRATVDQIERRLTDVDARRQATNEENDRLRLDLGRWTQFGEELGDRPLQGRLNGVSVFVVGTTGIEGGTLDALRSSITAAGATLDGTILFTGKWSLANDEDAVELAAVLDVPATPQPDALRETGIAVVADAWTNGDGGALVAALVARGFLQFQPGPIEAVPLPELPRQGSTFVIVSGDGADVEPAALAQPLVTDLSDADLRILAVQPVRPTADPPEEGEDEPAPEFVAALRADDGVAGRISTVDNVDDYRGRTAAVLALAELQSGRRGHYGFAADTRRVPAASP